MIICHIASIPERVAGLRRVVEDLYNQVDIFDICLNGYEKEVFEDSKIVQYLTDLGDEGKFYHQWDAYNVCVDDKYLYPRDYVAQLIGNVKKYDCPCGYHGRLFLGKIDSYYKNKDQIIFKGISQVLYDETVYILGTGMLGYHSSHIKIGLEDFKDSNMSDIYFGIAAKQQGVILKVLKHKAGWIQTNPLYTKSKSIFRQYVNNDSKQTQLINENF